MVVLLVAAWVGFGAFSSGASGFDMVNVKDMGAVGDGVQDDTQAFLDAIEKGREIKQNVYVPLGHYKISKTIEVDSIGITGPSVGAWPGDKRCELPSIIPVHLDAPAIHLRDSAAMTWLEVAYEPFVEDATDGPDAIKIEGSGIYIGNIRLRAPWNGIMPDPRHNVGRINIDNVFIESVQNIGVMITPTLDVPRLNNIEIWNHGITGRPMNQGVGFKLVHNDMIRMTDCFVFSMRVGFQFEQIPQTEGYPLHGMTWGVMNGCSVDACQYAIEVIGNHNISISGGLFWSHWGGLMVREEGDPQIRVVGCELKANGGPAMRWEGGGHGVFSGNTFFHPLPGYNTPAVELHGGQMILNGNDIVSSDMGVSVGDKLTEAIITNNIITAAQDHVKIHGDQPEDKLIVGSNVLKKYETME